MDYLTYDVVVIGSGAAGFNAANRIKQNSGLSVAILTEDRNAGSSRNTGSDKQTYYKLGISGDSPDSVRLMAEELFSCGSVDGDNALCEAALSLRCFMNLAELGVPFPTDRYGQTVGYKTDQELHERATSAGHWRNGRDHRSCYRRTCRNLCRQRLSEEPNRLSFACASCRCELAEPHRMAVWPCID